MAKINKKRKPTEISDGSTDVIRISNSEQRREKNNKFLIKIILIRKMLRRPLAIDLYAWNIRSFKTFVNDNNFQIGRLAESSINRSDYIIHNLDQLNGNSREKEKMEFGRNWMQQLINIII